jgi:hypothetical protein
MPIFEAFDCSIWRDFFSFKKNALHLKKKSIMLTPNSRLKGDFFNEKVTKKQTKFRRKQTKKVDFFSKKTNYYYHP